MNGTAVRAAPVLIPSRVESAEVIKTPVDLPITQLLRGVADVEDVVPGLDLLAVPPDLVVRVARQTLLSGRILRPFSRQSR